MDKVLTDESIMPFGKHKGKALKDVPHSYWIWQYETGCLKGTMLDYAKRTVPQLMALKENKEKK